MLRLGSHLVSVCNQKKVIALEECEVESNMSKPLWL
jgi:hypothetical protein